MSILYVVTDDKLSNGLSHVEVARRSYEGGADIVQLRVKNDDERFLQWACEISEISKSCGRTFIVNDSVEIALKSGADGVHVGQGDEPVSSIRQRVPENFIVGVSVGNVEEAKEAEAGGASYVALSPIFDTTSKDDAGHGHGLEMMKKISDAVSIPAYAIGGINKGNVKDIISHGADGVAVISAVVSQPDIAEAAKEFKELMNS
jgi:thiamine-phosphate pyrophosphorylase